MMKTMLVQVAPFLSFFLTSTQNYRTVSIFSGAAPLGTKCLDVRSPTLIDGTVAQIWDCNGDVTEQWQIGSPGSGNTEVKIAGSNMCLDAGITHSPHNLVLMQCNKSPQQQWIHTEDDRFKLLFNPNLCLDLPNSSTENEGQVLTYPCNFGKSQIWLPL